MRKRGRAGVAMVVAIGFAGAASAAQVLVTAPISSTFGDSDTVFCQAVNVSKKPVQVTFESHAVDGTVVTTKGPQTLAPGAVDGLQELGTAQYCKFLLSSSKKSVRAQAIYYDSGGGHYLLAIPAQ